MTDERIDIEIQDKISAGPANKLRAIAAAALEADMNVQKLITSLGSVNTAAFDKMATASAKATRATAQQTAAQAKMTNATARMTAATDKSAISQQRLATETQKTAAAQAKAAAATSQATTAANNAARSQLQLAAAQSRAAMMANAAGTAQSRSSKFYTEGTRASRQQRAALVNLSYQLQDIFVGLASGQKPMTVFIQQGFQIQGIAQGLGLGLRGLRDLFLTLVPPPVLAGLAAAALGMGVLTNEVRKATGVQVSFGDTFKAVFQVMGREIMGAIRMIPGITSAFNIMYDGVVAIMKQLALVITAPFVFAYNEVITVWKNLAPALGEIFVAAFNGVLIIIETAINSILSGFNKINPYLNAIAKKLGGIGNIQLFDEVKLARVSTDFKALSALVGDTGKNLAYAMDEKRLEAYFNAIAQQAAKNKAERDKEKAGRKETFADIVREYEYEIAALRQVGLERERIMAIGKAEDKLKRPLTAPEAAKLSGLVGQLKTIEFVNELNQSLITLQAQMPLLDNAFQQGLITVDQYREKVLALNIEVAKLDNSFTGGLRVGLLEVEKQFTDINSVVSDGVVNAFRGAEDALVSFVSKGKVDFKGFVDSLIADLARLYVRMQIMRPLMGALGLSSWVTGSPVPVPEASFAVGTGRVPRDMIAQIHKDEIIVPASQSRAIRAGKASLGTSGGAQYNTFAPSISVSVQGGGTQAQQTQQAQNMAKIINDEVEKKYMEMSRRETKQGGLWNRQNVVA